MRVAERKNSRFFSDVAAALLLIAGTAHAEDVARRLLIDQRLDVRQVDLAGLEAGTLWVADERGQLESLAWRDFVGFVSPDSSAHAPAGSSVLELVDGQRLVGTLVAGETSSAGPGVWWDHASFGTMRVPLEDIADIVLRDRVASVPESGELIDDVVMLVNGDRLEGFVERIGETVVIDAGDGVEQVPLESVGAIVLSNPARGMDGAYVWLADGSVVSIESVGAIKEGRVRLNASLADISDDTSPEAGFGEVSIADLLAMVFDAHQVVALATIEPTGQTTPPERRWSEGVVIGDPHAALLGGATIELPGPMSVWWTLPEGATRLSFQAQLPRSMRAWGDCDLIIETSNGGAWREILRERLHGDRPVVQVNVAINASKLRIRVDEGRYGPIQDHVQIDRALLLVEQH